MASKNNSSNPPAGLENNTEDNPWFGHFDAQAPAWSEIDQAIAQLGPLEDLDLNAMEVDQPEQSRHSADEDTDSNYPEELALTPIVAPQTQRPGLFDDFHAGDADWQMVVAPSPRPMPLTWPMADIVDGIPIDPALTTSSSGERPAPPRPTPGASQRQQPLPLRTRTAGRPPTTPQTSSAPLASTSGRTRRSRTTSIAPSTPATPNAQDRSYLPSPPPFLSLHPPTHGDHWAHTAVRSHTTTPTELEERRRREDAIVEYHELLRRRREQCEREGRPWIDPLPTWEQTGRWPSPADQSSRALRPTPVRRGAISAATPHWTPNESARRSSLRANMVQVQERLAEADMPMSPLTLPWGEVLDWPIRRRRSGRSRSRSRSPVPGDGEGEYRVRE